MTAIAVGIICVIAVLLLGAFRGTARATRRRHPAMSDGSIVFADGGSLDCGSDGGGCDGGGGGP
jgi:hypothetical protein